MQHRIPITPQPDLVKNGTAFRRQGNLLVAITRPTPEDMGDYECTGGYIQQLKDIQDDEVLEEGFESIEDFYQHWQEYHEWNPQIWVWVYEYKLSIHEKIH